MHTQFSCTHAISCVVSSEPQTHEKAHELLVHVYTFLYTHMHVLVIHVHIITYALSYIIANTNYLLDITVISLQFFSTFIFETSDSKSCISRPINATATN